MKIPKNITFVTLFPSFPRHAQEFHEQFHLICTTLFPFLVPVNPAPDKLMKNSYFFPIINPMYFVIYSKVLNMLLSDTHLRILRKQYNYPKNALTSSMPQFLHPSSSDTFYHIIHMKCRCSCQFLEQTPSNR